jgi:membrane protease YdiL (CAAX protease family)
MAFFLSFGLALVDPFIPEHIIEAYLKIMEEAQLGESLFTNLAGCLLAPIGEELIFRGVMLYFLMKVIKGCKHEKVVFWVVNLLQAVAFGAFHMNLYQGMYATVLGLLIGFMAYRSKTVLVPILIHMVYNTSQIVLMDPIGNALPENMVLYAIITELRQYIEPKLVAGQLGLPPIATLMSMYLGLKIFGVIGMFVPPFTITILKVLNDDGIILIWRTSHSIANEGDEHHPSIELKKISLKNRKKQGKKRPYINKIQKPLFCLGKICYICEL